MKITYNAPVVLTFALLCAAIMVVDVRYLPGITDAFFTIYPDLNFTNPFSFFRLSTHVIGHASWGHLVNNFTFILLLGPMLEEKYGSFNLFVMILFTAITTGILNVTVFETGLMGASGVVFMFILLSSFTNFRAGHIPLTFIVVVGLFLGNEIMSAMGEDNISQFAHIAGGICGAFFGYIFAKPRLNKTASIRPNTTIVNR